MNNQKIFEQFTSPRVTISYTDKENRDSEREVVILEAKADRLSVFDLKKNEVRSFLYSGIRGYKWTK